MISARIMGVLAGVWCSFSAMAEAPAWEFGKASGLSGWTLAGVKEHSLVDTGVEMVSGKDCQMFVGKLNAKADEYPFVEVLMEIDKDAMAQIFFASADGKLSEAASVRFKALAGGERLYRVYCGGNPLWTGELSRLRLDPTNDQDVKIKVKSVRLSGPEWVFNEENSLSGWKANPDMRELAYTADALTFLSGKDPHIISPELNVSAEMFRSCEVEIKSDKDSLLQLFFAAKGQNFSEPASVRVALKASGEWRKVKIDCGANPQWQGRIARLRLDPVSNQDITVEIKSIKLLP